MASLKIIKGDKVIVTTGKDKGKVGEVLKSLPTKNKVLVSGVNEAKKHQKPTRNSKGGIITKAMPIDASNVAFYDEKNKKPAKVGFKIVDNKKKRYIKETNEIIG